MALLWSAGSWLLRLVVGGADAASPGLSLRRCRSCVAGWGHLRGVQRRLSRRHADAQSWLPAPGRPPPCPLKTKLRTPTEMQSFFGIWWRQQDADTRALVNKLVQDGQVAFVCQGVWAKPELCCFVGEWLGGQWSGGGAACSVCLVTKAAVTAARSTLPPFLARTSTPQPMPPAVLWSMAVHATRWNGPLTSPTFFSPLPAALNPQLSFVNGGYVQHDEAAAYYVAMIDQTTRGHT